MQEVITLTTRVGQTSLITVNPAISTSAYVAGNTVGGAQNLANAVTTRSGTGLLQSLVILDKANQKAPLDILIFSKAPVGAMTDHAAFAFGAGDDLNIVARVSVAASDYVTLASEAVAVKSSLGIAVKAVNGGTSLYAVAVTSGTPTYTALALNFIWGILPD